jgi:hypothetical protein
MNLFVLDSDPVKAAQLNCDVHTSKMILESAQILSTTFHLQGIEAPYKASHVNHPTSKWVRESRANFDWTVKHGIALYEEKLYRTGKGHKSVEVIEWAKQNAHLLKFEKQEQTTFAIAISDTMLCRKDPNFNLDNPVECYKLYYKHDKRHIGKWKNRPVPEWFNL